MAAITNTGVRTQHPDYIRLSPKWQRCKDVCDGQDAVHAKTTAYLRKLTNETPTAYSDRLADSDLFNASWRAIAVLAGMAFRKSPVAVVPGGVKEYLTDIDMAGCSLDALAKKTVEDALEFGPYGLMVDYPPAQVADDGNVVTMTVKTAEDNGLRPLIQYYPILSIINWRKARVNNRTVPVMVVLKEAAPVHEDEFSHKTEDRYRVLDLDLLGFYRQRLFRIDDKGKDEQVGSNIYPQMNGKGLNYIPFRIEGDMEDPPLIDLVDKNLAHYRLNSILQHTLKFGPPVFYIAGHTLDAGETISIGGTSALVFPNPDTKVGYAEPKGDIIPAMERMLDRMESQMATLSVRAVADESKQVETFGATKTKRVGENSTLADIVIGASEAIEWALKIFCEWAGKPGELSYKINREFLPAGMDAQQLTALLKTVQSGQMSEQEFFDLLQEADLVAADKTFEQHQEETATMEPPRPAPAANDQTGAVA